MGGTPGYPGYPPPPSGSGWGVLHPWQGRRPGRGGYPIHGGGYPGYPHLDLTGGYPSLMGGNLDIPHLDLDLAEGVPHPWQGVPWHTSPCLDLARVPHPVQGWMEYPPVWTWPEYPPPLSRGQTENITFPNSSDAVSNKQLRMVMLSLFCNFKTLSKYAILDIYIIALCNKLNLTLCACVYVCVQAFSIQFQSFDMFIVLLSIFLLFRLF